MIRFDRRRDERGGVVVIIGVLLAFGVILGMVSISLDVGRLLVEKRQLQNAADASAISLAQSCVDGNCVSGADGLATLADQNANDQVTQIQSQCGKNIPATTSTNLPACPAPTGGLADCSAVPPNVDPGASYVEVRTRTSSPDGAGGRVSGMTNFIAGMLGTSTSSAAACARAAWGPVGGYQGSLPLSISICEWIRYAGVQNTNAGLPAGLPAGPAGAYPGYNATGSGGQTKWPAPYAGWPNTTGKELYVMTHSDSSADCSYQGKDTAGGFGWLDNTNCATNISLNASGNYWAQIQTGNAVPQSCKDIIDAYQGKQLLVPIFDCLTKSNTLPAGGITSQPSCDGSNAGGNKTWYHVLGLATFYVSGNKLSTSSSKVSLVNGVEPCSPSSPTGATPNPWTGQSGRCIAGWFVNQDLLSPGGTVGPPTGGVNLGTLQIRPAG